MLLPLDTGPSMGDCSGCFRLERLPGGACTHWKAPPYHGARQLRPFVVAAASSCKPPLIGRPTTTPPGTQLTCLSRTTLVPAGNGRRPPPRVPGLRVRPAHRLVAATDHLRASRRRARSRLRPPAASRRHVDPRGVTRTRGNNGPALALHHPISPSARSRRPVIT